MKEPCCREALKLQESVAVSEGKWTQESLNVLMSHVRHVFMHCLSTVDICRWCTSHPGPDHGHSMPSETTLGPAWSRHVGAGLPRCLEISRQSLCRPNFSEPGHEFQHLWWNAAHLGGSQQPWCWHSWWCTSTSFSSFNTSGKMVPGIMFV